MHRQNTRRKGKTTGRGEKIKIIAVIVMRSLFCGHRLEEDTFILPENAGENFFFFIYTYIYMYYTSVYVYYYTYCCIYRYAYVTMEASRFVVSPKGKSFSHRTGTSCVVA